MKTACTVQCPQCPFRPDALPSYLGTYTAESIVSSLWHNEPFFCHTKINYSNPGWERVAKTGGKLCLGSMVFAGKLKAPLTRIEDNHDVEVIEARLANQDRTDVECMTPNQFLSHHNPANITANMKKVKKPIKKVAKLKPLPAIKGKPTDADIQTEIARLKEMAPLVRPTSMFGDDNLQLLKDHIWVLENRANDDEIYGRFDLINEGEEPDEDDRAIANEAEKRSFERAYNALEARRWMIGDSKERPSTNWEGLVQ